MKEKIMRKRIFILIALLATAFSMITITSVAAAPNVDNFGGKGEAWEQQPLGPGQMFTNVHNGLIIHWVPGLKSPHHIGLTTDKPGMNSNGAVEDTTLPGASDVLPSAFWGPPPKRP
jgi:hypothetical protein